MLKRLMIFACAASLVGFAACKSVKVDTDTYPTVVTVLDEPSSSRSNMLPKAHIYMTDGDFNRYVPITLNFMRTVIVSYPAPSDISATSAPIPLASGYLLDRRGVSANSAFTTYTWEEYSALPQTPSREELWKSIIPGARVTRIVELPMTVQQAVADTAACNKLIRDGLQGCKLIFEMPAPVL